ncbi:hypothetical protein HYU40_03800 [Candidatus Woesearchaeota archaeon]|nr:hypothetical protein [Candidatus Woesearchaeota archaeon]
MLLANIGRGGKGGSSVTEQDVVEVLAERDPLTGREITEQFGADYYEDRELIFYLWAVCTNSCAMARKTVGTRYLRIDKDTGKLGITPAIPREFADFTVLGMNTEEVAAKAEQIMDYHAKVSEGKKALARGIIAECERRVGYAHPQSDISVGMCFLLVGDVAYGMSSDFRREVNGEYVKGSDLDIVIIHSEDAPAAILDTFDKNLLDLKWAALKREREEVDYVIKSINRVKEQAAMSTPKEAAACKIISEGVLIHGSQSLYERARGIVASSGAAGKLQAMTARAALLREAEERKLLEDLVGNHRVQ